MPVLSIQLHQFVLVHTPRPRQSPTMNFVPAKHFATLSVFIISFACSHCLAQTPSSFGIETEKLLYHSAMDSSTSLTDWIMEGPGQIEFADGWMKMRSPNEKMHHVYWCPETFPTDFVAQWDMQNQHLEAGLCIVFFAATGLNGEDPMDASLPKRDGTFSQYNNAALKNYHISYFANNPKLPARPVARLRKNPGKNIVSEGPPGIEADSDQVHRITLVKDSARIRLFVDDRPIIDWTDENEVNGGPLGTGKIGLRHMDWPNLR